MQTPGLTVERSASAVVVRGRHGAGCRWFAVWMLCAWLLAAVAFPAPIADAVRGPAPRVTGTVRGRIPDWLVVVAIGAVTTGLAFPWVSFDVRVTATTVRLRWRYLGWTYRQESLPTDQVAFRRNDEPDLDGGFDGPALHCAVYRRGTPLRLYLGSRGNADALVRCLDDAIAEMRDGGP